MWGAPEAIVAVLGAIGSGLIGAFVFSFRTGSAVERVNQQLSFMNQNLGRLEARMDRFETRYNMDGQYMTLHAKRPINPAG